jgi:hypothetical protein
MLRTVALLIAITIFGCGTAQLNMPARELSDSSMERELNRSLSTKNRSRAAKLVAAVLDDALRHEYRYGYYSRKNAFYAILELDLAEVTEPLREVAALPYEPRSLPPNRVSPEAKQRSYQNLLDFIAITGALDNLTLLRDRDALTLNLMQLKTPSIRGRAVANLQLLKAWDATGDVRQMLIKTELTKAAFLDLRAAADFLANSPQASPMDCALIPKFKTAYWQCFDSSLEVPGITGCEEFVRSLKILANRLNCERTG